MPTDKSQIDESQVQWDESPQIDESQVQWDESPKMDSWGDWAKKQAGSFATGVGSVVPFGQDIPAAIGASLAGTPLAPSYVPEEGTWGERFDAAKRAQMAAAEKAGEIAPTAKAAGMLTGIAGTIPAAELAVPAEAALAAKLAPKVGQTVADIAATGAAGAGMGAVQGLGEGVSAEERLGSAATGAGLGAGLGTVLSGIGKVAQAMPKPKLTESEEAAERMGFGLPRYLGGEKPWQKAAATAASAIPLGGGAIKKSAQAAKENLEKYVEKTMGGPRPSFFDAGTTAKQAIAEWMKPTSSKIMQRAYDRVDDLVNPKVRTPLTNVKKALNDARTKNYVMGLVETDASFAPLAEQALSKTSGLTYEGIKNLRTKVNEMLEAPSLLPAGTSTRELLSFKNALTADLENAVERAGGPAAKAAWEKANRLNVLVQQRRKNLAQIVGERGDVPEERVFSRIAGMASSGGGANLNRLKMVRKSMSPDEWQDVTSGVIGTLGRTRAGEFNPVQFVSHYGSMPADTKNIMFGPTGNPTRQALDDILAVSRKFGEMNEYANPSGTAKVAAGIAMLSNPFGVLYKGPLAAAFMGKILSRPRTAKGASRVMGAFEQDLRKAVDPEKANSATQIALRDFMNSFHEGEKMVAEDKRQERASGGKVGSRDYPAKRLNKVERALKKAQDALALETESLMEKPDEQIAQALRIAKGEQ